jgi:hypothetical protein
MGVSGQNKNAEQLLKGDRYTNDVSRAFLNTKRVRQFE